VIKSSGRVYLAEGRTNSTQDEDETFGNKEEDRRENSIDNIQRMKE